MSQFSDPRLPRLLAALPRGWEAWSGVGSGMLYARRKKTSPPVVLRGADPIGLAARAQVWEHEHVTGCCPAAPCAEHDPGERSGSEH